MHLFQSYNPWAGGSGVQQTVINTALPVISPGGSRGPAEVDRWWTIWPGYWWHRQKEVSKQKTYFRSESRRSSPGPRGGCSSGPPSTRTLTFIRTWAPAANTCLFVLKVVLHLIWNSLHFQNKCSIKEDPRSWSSLKYPHNWLVWISFLSFFFPLP